MPLGVSQRFTHARVEPRATAPHFNLRNSICFSCPLCTCRCSSTGQREGKESKFLRSSCCVVDSRVMNNKASTAITISYLTKQENITFWLFIRCVFKVLIILLLSFFGRSSKLRPRQSTTTRNPSLLQSTVQSRECFVPGVR